MELKNSTILITGGTSGIGLEFVKQFLEQEANIIVTGRNRDALNATKKRFPDVHTFQSDVSKLHDIEQLYEDVAQRFPALNIIVNNAGIMRNMDLLDTSMSLEGITKEIDTNLSGTIRMVHQFLPHLRKQQSAAIVNISSSLAFVPYPISPVYSATKAAIHAYTRVLRLQLKKTNVRVFELAPPGTETPLMDGFRKEVDSKQNMKVDEMVTVAIKGILNDQKEIRPGLSNTLKLMSRIAPNALLNFLNNRIEKTK